MAALVQTISQPMTTVSMLQTRPASSSATTFSHQRGGSSPRSGNILQYRPSTTVPQPLNQIQANNQNPLRQHPTNSRLENRSMSAPGEIPPAMTGSSSKVTEQTDPYLKTDPNRLSLLSTSLDLSLTDPRLDNGTKPSADKHHTHRRTETSSARLPTQTSTTLASESASANLYNMPSQSLSSPSNIGVSKDDTAISQLSGIAQKYRRRSIATQDKVEPSVVDSEPKPLKSTQSGPIRTWASVVATPYTPPKPNTQAPQLELGPLSTNDGLVGGDITFDTSLTNEESSSQEPATFANGVKIINIPPRSSSDATKRLNNPSPLSRPLSTDMQQAVTQSSFAKLVSEKPAESQPQPPKPVTESPAQQHLASLSKKDGKKDGKPSRLRRAFSFGSAAELRKASAENSHAATTRKLQKPQYENEEEAREAAIVKQQEAGGLGNSIYSGQGNVFSSSTDNLSVSSTASSASIMLRKMGKGMKKGTRSLVGLFRPKSVIGVPAADSAVPELSTAQVSMVTVEAEREKVNVNVHPSDQAGGETGFPKLERNSLEAGGSAPSLTTSDRSTDGIKPRRSFVGSEKDRTEVLAAVKKGILKRADTDSGTSSPAIKSPELSLPQLPQSSRFNAAPRSTTPNTADESASRGHRRTDSVTIEGEDYFISMGRFTASDAKSLPGTPRSARNISFSPRIQFHDTWTANDYDRRSEIATCNRLTPSLAQAIKEELNTFKMEMEVHESSKVYTHFF